MLFNSISFALFLPVVFFLYWFITNKNLRAQNFLLLSASYFFYACWDYRFLFLLIFSTFLDYFTGLKIATSTNAKHRKFWFWLSVIVNLGFLGIFKYYNFFAESFATTLSAIGIKTNFWTLKVILPVGISFYTFHGLSYVIDVYKKRITAENNFIDYGVFVSFFPLLVAGPIERATHLLPQIQSKRTFKYAEAINGLRQILWGLFKKVVIADNCAQLANLTFEHPAAYNGSTLVLGAIFFAVQIYGDFSGYSDIALGTAKLFGINLLRNFAFPYFSRDIAEFWRRWHISLSSWFKDYLYIPLGGSRGSKFQSIRNTFIIFLVSGFWHGANWTFIFWGLLHALYFLPLLLLNKNRNHLETVAQGKILPSIGELLKMGVTFFLVVVAWIFFRSENLESAFFYFEGFARNFFLLPEKKLFTSIEFAPIVFITLLFFFILIEWIGREKPFALFDFGTKKSRLITWSTYCLIVLCIICFSGKEQQFIYFQF